MSLPYTKPLCELCGLPAVVHIAHAGGGAAIRHYCFHCADEVDERAGRDDRRLNLAAVVGLVGLMILSISLLADFLGFGSSDGFGWQQIGGLAVSGVVALCGLIVRAPTLLVSGILFGGIAILADWLAFGSSTGFGPYQMLGCVVGLGMLLMGLIVARKQALREEAGGR